MIQNKKQFFKIVVIVLVAILFLLSILLFSKAVVQSNKNEEFCGYDPQIHVFINQNDSIVEKLREDVVHLSSLIENMQKDTVIIEMRALKETKQ